MKFGLCIDCFHKEIKTFTKKYVCGNPELLLPFGGLKPVIPLDFGCNFFKPIRVEKYDCRFETLEQRVFKLETDLGNICTRKILENKIK